MIPDAFRTPDGDAVTAVTAEEMARVDRVAVEDVGVALLQMMENAGRTLAARVGTVADASALVVAGNGGNGGGGLACARHLANHGLDVELVLDRPPGELTGAAARQYRVLDAMGTPTHAGVAALQPGAEPDVLVDALIGYGLSGEVREPARGLVEAMNAATAPVVSLDVPSGLDATTGEVHGVAVHPDRTVTLALPKTGLTDRREPLDLADIGLPAVVYRRAEIEYDAPFGRAAWVELRG